MNINNLFKATCSAALALALLLSFPVWARDFSKLVILHTNDTHGYVEADAQSCGLSVLPAIKQKYEDKGYQVLLLDAGDATQDNQLANFSKGEFIIKLFNELGYDAMTIGNHEFDFGKKVLQHNIAKAKFPIISSNIIENSKLLLFAKPYTIIEKGSHKIGVIGFTTAETITTTLAKNIEDLTFLRQDQLVENTQKLINQLKTEGCDLIIGLGHLGDDIKNEGFRSTDLLENVQGIDIFIDGHDHDTNNQEVGRTLLVETGDHSKNIGLILFEDGRFVGNLLEVNQCQSFAKDQKIEALIKAEKDKIESKLNKVIATSTFEIDGSREPGNRTYETNAGDLITDAMLWKANEKLKKQGLKADLALVNGGSIRASIKKGKITNSHIKAMLPYENDLYMVTVSGKTLLEILECSTSILPRPIAGFPQASNINYSVNTKAPYESAGNYKNSNYKKPKNLGARVSIGSINGKPFNLKHNYNLVVTKFILTGGDSYDALKDHKNIIKQVDLKAEISETLIEYLQNRHHGLVPLQYEHSQNRIKIY